MTATAKENVTESPRKSSRIVKSKRVVATRNDAAVEEPNETSPQPPQENDVLLYSQADWPGNSFFYKLLERRKDEFQRLERSKRTIAEEVVTLVVENNGRFFTPQGNSWTCVEDTETLVNEIISALEANSPAPMPNTTYKHSLYSSSSPYNMTVVQPTQPTYYVSPTPVPTERATLLEKKKLKPSPSPAKKHTVVKHKFQEDVSSYSQKAAFKMALNKEMALPKGVTMRPSGKWQAQIYFAGQSRYLGVFRNSKMAAIAFQVASTYLKRFRTMKKSDEASKTFAAARKAAQASVMSVDPDGVV